MERKRKLDARARRQESLRNQGVITVEKTIIQVPQPKALRKKEIIEVKKEVTHPMVSEIVKRGPGRPPKAIAVVNKKNLKAGTLQTTKAKGKTK